MIIRFDTVVKFIKYGYKVFLLLKTKDLNRNIKSRSGENFSGNIWILYRRSGENMSRINYRELLPRPGTFSPRPTGTKDS
jgi:hypothetical protein